MTDISTILYNAGQRVFGVFGQDAFFNPATGESVQCRVVLDAIQDLRGDGSQSWGTLTTLEALLADLPHEPNRGEYFTVNGQAWHVAEVVSNDNVYVKCVVR